MRAVCPESGGVEVNGKNKGTLGGKAVSDAILATWIGPRPGPGSDFIPVMEGRAVFKEAVSRMPDAVRSDHPTHSVAAIGARARSP